MKHELWLEYGFLKDDTYSRDMLWYNEGNWEELPHFLNALWRYRDRPDMYFYWRYGGRRHFIKGRDRA